MLKFADISHAGIGLIYNATLREIEITNNFMISTWNKTDTSECRHLTEDENDQCQIIKWLEEMNLREQTNRIYSVQLDGLNDNTTTNMSGMRLVQVSGCASSRECCIQTIFSLQTHCNIVHK